MQHVVRGKDGAFLQALTNILKNSHPEMSDQTIVIVSRISKHFPRELGVPFISPILHAMKFVGISTQRQLPNQTRDTQSFKQFESPNLMTQQIEYSQRCEYHILILWTDESR